MIVQGLLRVQGILRVQSVMFWEKNQNVLIQEYNWQWTLITHAFMWCSICDNGSSVVRIHGQSWSLQRRSPIADIAWSAIYYQTSKVELSGSPMVHTITLGFCVTWRQPKRRSQRCISWILPKMFAERGLNTTFYRVLLWILTCKVEYPQTVRVPKLLQL